MNRREPFSGMKPQHAQWTSGVFVPSYEPRWVPMYDPVELQRAMAAFCAEMEKRHRWPDDEQT